MTDKRKNILLLCAEAARHTGTVDLHIKAFEEHSQYNILVLDSYVANTLDVDLSMFDAIVMHYSIVISLPQYIPAKFAEQLSNFNGPKVLFIQDEFRWVDRTSEAAKKLGVSVIFTVVNEDVIRNIYRDEYFDKVRFEQTLTGFVPEYLVKRPVPDYEDRTIDIGYRARKLPGWCGSFALQKWHIGERTLQDADKFALECDIAMSEASRIYGDDWINFLSNCKATLGTESGASFIDYTGLAFQEIDEYEMRNPDASFEEVKDKFLEGRDGEVVIHVISPRVFEAAALRTLMIMYPGTYSEVAQPGRHYLELKQDHSNMADIISILRDPTKASEIIENAYNEIACSDKWTHATFIEQFDNVVDEEIANGVTANDKAPIGAVQSTGDKSANLGRQKYISELITASEQTKNDETERARQAELQRIVEAQTQLEQEKLGEVERLKNLDAQMERARLAEIEFERLRQANVIGSAKVQKKMRIILILQNIRVGTYNFIVQNLPRSISVPLLNFGGKLSRLLKPIFKKILFK